MSRSARRDGWRDGRYLALDLETTGLDPASDAVLSFGAIPIDAGRVRLDRAAYRVADPGIPIPSETVRIHGIRPADIRTAAPVEVVLSELGVLLDGRIPVVWTAWVEASFLPGRRRRWLRRMVDVRWLVVRLDERNGGSSPARRDSLHDTATRLGVPLEDAHHALADAFVTAQLFLLAAARLGGDARGLVRLGRRP